ncbi:MAG: peptidylprolyl isomerase [Christensenellales bacterium]|jgi:hypothetical protein
MIDKRIRILAAMLVLLFAFSGCSMIVIDEEMDNAEHVAEFTGGFVTKGEARESLAQLVNSYAAYGADIAAYGTDFLNEQKENILQMLAEDKIVKLKAESFGFTEIPEEKQAELKEQAQKDYDDMIAMYTSSMPPAAEGEDDPAKQAQEFLAKNYGYTLESVVEGAIDGYWQDLLYEEVTKDVSVTDAEKEAAYQQLVSGDQEKYRDDPAAFERAMTGGTDVAWVPEGYRTVKHILIKLTDEEISALSTLKADLSSVEAQIDDLETAIAEAAAADEADAAEEAPLEDAIEEAAEEPADTTAEEAAEEPAEQTDEEELAELNAQKAELEAEIAALEAAYKEKLMPKAQEALDLIAGGTSFEDVIAQYGEDPGMQNEPTKTIGYYVSANSAMWEQVFTDTAMALQNVGDVSEPVLGSNGLHIIKYISDVTPGAVDTEELRATAAENALKTAKDASYDAAVEQWVKDANVKTYLKRFD